MGARRVAVIGGGPAGLMAAEAAAGVGAHVTLYDHLPSVGRKLLIAGKGGLNLTHAEDPARFIARYGARRTEIGHLLGEFGPAEVRAWAHDLGIDTIVGTSQRVFPADLKAAPLLRAWLRRLRALGVVFEMRHRWSGWTADGALRFATAGGERVASADATVLALGGASWPRLGSDGQWVTLLTARGIDIQPLRPANCGFECAWSPHFAARFAGAPVKSVVVSIATGRRAAGEFMITQYGVEGGAIYALSAALRDAVEASGEVVLDVDLAPQRDLDRLVADLARARGPRSVATQLRRAAGIEGVKAGLLREVLPRAAFDDPARVARTIKRLGLRLTAARPIEEAISSAGGVPFEALDEHSMLRALPGVFCAGEMLDWEAPTGGYLLTACLASGRAAGRGAAQWRSGFP